MSSNAGWPKRPSTFVNSDRFDPMDRMNRGAARPASEKPIAVDSACASNPTKPMISFADRPRRVLVDTTPQAVNIPIKSMHFATGPSAQPDTIGVR